MKRFMSGVIFAAFIFAPAGAVIGWQARPVYDSINHQWQTLITLKNLLDK